MAFSIQSDALNLKPSYLFTEVARRERQYKDKHPGTHLLNLSVGDVSGPIVPVAIEAMHKAVSEQASRADFHGYGDERGAEWLRRRVAEWDYQRRGLNIQPSEVFISAGAADDLGNLSELFSQENIVAIPEPTYPEYRDVSIMAGRSIITPQMTPENNFEPPFPEQVPDIIYLCSPNNPTGSVLTKNVLSRWVDYARKHHSVIIFDAAYEAYIHTPDVPHSIYECDGAMECAIEVKSFSKTAGFTGIRCGYTVCPKALVARIKTEEEVSLNAMWRRRQCTKTNGVSYITMRGAEAILSKEGQRQVQPYIDACVENATCLREALLEVGWQAYGGTNSPYVWCRVPNGMDSWGFFDFLMEEMQIICVPGIGFGEQGDDFVRFAAFGDRADIQEAITRLHEWTKK